MTHEMVERSPAFKRQLRRIGAEPRVTAQLRLTGDSGPYGSLARSLIVRTRTGLLHADIDIPIPLMSAYRYVELIAHELEHLIEQIEGLDFRKLARQPGSGVHRADWIAGRPYETIRAQAAGETVAQEFRNRPARASRCAPTDDTRAVD